MSLTPEQKRQVIEAATLDVEKRFGKGTVIKGNEKPMVPTFCSSGSIKLDTAIGVGGIPVGRTIEIFGPEASGKTTLALTIIAECQKKGGTAVFVDMEYALDSVWATALGVNMNELLFSQPNCGEEALEVVESYAKTNAVDIIVIDSVAALVPKAEIDGEMGDAHMGLQARLMSQAMRKLTAIIGKSECTVIFINQIRHKMMTGKGNPEVTTGGNALKFYASVRIECRRQLGESTRDEKLGMSIALIKATIVKNKVAPPFKVVLLDLYTGADGAKPGFNVYAEIGNLGVDYDLIEKSGTWYAYKGERIGQGKDAVTEFLKNTPHIFEEIKTQIMEKIQVSNSPVIGSYDAIKNSRDLEPSAAEIGKVIDNNEDTDSDAINGEDTPEARRRRRKAVKNKKGEKK